MNNQAILRYVSNFWEHAILESLSAYIEIPNKSPMFDAEWAEHGHMYKAVAHIVDWINRQEVPGLIVETHELPGLTPTILMELPGEVDDTVLIYGHLDKQPEFTGWHEGLAPWTPVRRGDRLYGRGGADDGYAAYAAIAMLKALGEQGLPLPRIVILIEGSEESGSPDLPHYMAALGERIGKPGLVMALDSTCGNYEQLWLTTSLRGMLIGELRVDVLEEGVHSGVAGGIVASSFRILRQLLSRLENPESGAITPAFLNEPIPDVRRAEAAEAGSVLAEEFNTIFPYAGGSGPLSDDPTELVLCNTWLASLEITGMAGIPDLDNAGNVLRPYTTAKFGLRLPPTTDVAKVAEELTTLLTADPPGKVAVSLKIDTLATGWHAPVTEPYLEESLRAASQEFFGAPAVSIGCGGSIPFMQFLADTVPQAQFVVTGVLGPHSNAHGPNEFLHLPTAIKLTASMAKVIYDWGQR
jgi:acetylornithine deacetylase/succinyl-diaminopimelate desuccinylase-like protein